MSNLKKVRNHKKSVKSGNERITELIVEKYLRKLGYFENIEIKVEPQKSAVPQIDKLLSNASKAGNGAGRPDYIIHDTKNKDIVMVIECKADITKHISPNLDQYKDYAVDGARLYADYLSQKRDVIYLGVSGQTEAELKVSHYVLLKGEERATEIFKDCEIQPYSDYLEQLKNNRFRVDYEDLLKYVSQLNEQLHSKKIPEKERAILFSGILIALDDDTFREGYASYRTAGRLANFLIDSVADILNESNIPKERQAGLKSTFAAIKSHTGLIKDGYLINLVSEIDDRVRTFIRGNEYTDIISRCYIEFLKYANDDGGLGIVLTPSHITDLFCNLACVDKNSVVIDNCCGTGGFLVAAMRHMIKNANGDKKKISDIKAKQIIGIEWQNHIFNLCVSNMILHGDGKSNIWNGDCFELIDKLQALKPNIALLNPPYADVSKKDELLFVENALDALEKGGRAVAILPMRCALYQKGAGLEIKRRLLGKHTLQAVMSMPEQLFYPKGVVCCVMVFEAHTSHISSGIKTWFGYWKDDGHILVKNKGRVDRQSRWDAIKNKWIEAYRNRDEIIGLSVKHKITASDEWCAEAYMETDYTQIKQSDFEEVVRNYAVFKLLHKK